jgi:hypothetical protein
MKTTLVILLLLFSFSLFGQEAQNPGAFQYEFSPPDTSNHNDNVFYISMAGVPPSIGIRYDRYFGRIGAYVAGITGKYPGGDYIENRQMRYSLGGIYRLNYIRDQIDSPIVSLGLVYHDWLTKDYVEGYINTKRAFREWSFEIGMGGRIKRFNVSGRADFMQMEVCMDFGFNF